MFHGVYGHHDPGNNLYVPNAVTAGAQLALAALSFPGDLFQHGLNTAYDIGSSLVPERVAAKFNRYIGNRPTRAFPTDDQGNYVSSHRYDGISGWLPRPGEESIYVKPNDRVIWESPGILMKSPHQAQRGKLPVVPSEVYQMKNVAELANMGMNRLYHDRYSLWNKLKALRYGDPTQFTRKAAFFNRKVILPRGPLTRGQKRSYLLAKIRKAPRRKRKRSYKRV